MPILLKYICNFLLYSRILKTGTDLITSRIFNGQMGNSKKKSFTRSSAFTAQFVNMSV